MKTYSEIQNLNYPGSIIDVETIGNFAHGYPKHDSREFKDMKIVIFGIINANKLSILCAEGKNDLDALLKTVKVGLSNYQSRQPLYAYNAHFEMGTLYHHYGIKIPFDFELQPIDCKNKEAHMENLGIYNDYGDPFNAPPSRGLQCSKAWESNDFDRAIRHNRACLLKEQAIMLQNKFNPIIPFTFNDNINQTNTNNVFSPWTEAQNSTAKTMWNNNETISTIATKLDRSPKAIFMRLQKFGLISNSIEFSTDRCNWNKTSLQKNNNGGL